MTTAAAGRCGFTYEGFKCGQPLEHRWHTHMGDPDTHTEIAVCHAFVASEDAGKPWEKWHDCDPYCDKCHYWVEGMESPCLYDEESHANRIGFAATHSFVQPPPTAPREQEAEAKPMMATWSCKIGEAERAGLPHGSDQPMRKAAEEAYRRLTGRDPDFIFSGWGAELSEAERAVVEDRMPTLSAPTALKALDALWVIVHDRSCDMVDHGDSASAFWVKVRCRNGDACRIVRYVPSEGM